MIGDKIKTLRKREGLSQEELASRLGLTRQAVSRWETGDATPDTAVVVALSEMFGVSTDYLLKDSVEEVPVSVPGVKKKSVHLRWGILCVAAAGVVALLLLLVAALQPKLFLGTYGWTDPALWRDNHLVPFAVVIVLLLAAVQLWSQLQRK